MLRKEFCEKMCRIQGDTEHVEDYINAYLFAVDVYENINIIDEKIILRLGELTLPEVNKNGFRTTPVVFQSGKRGIYHYQIDSQMDLLVEYQNLLPPIEFYTEFERIHPFADGNGRVGALLFNILNDTILDPVLPKEPRWY